MSILGKALDYGTPAGWGSMAAKKAGLIDDTYGGSIDSFANGMDRSKKAEELYGGVNAKSMEVPNFWGQYNKYGQAAQGYGQQGSGFRNDQASFGHVLANEAMGHGVGQQLVGMQARQAANRASAQQFSAVAGARPGMQAMASRNAMLGSALAQSQVGENAAGASAQMTIGAQQAYGQHLQAARGQDQQQQQQNNAAQLQAYQQRMQLSGLQQNGAMSAEQQRTERYKALMGAPTQNEIVAGAAMGGASAIFGMGKKG
jgi:hypothetical protein